MRFQRRLLRSPLLAIALLVILSVITVVSIGEGFKVLAIRRDGISLRKRDGSTITFNLPWKSAHDNGDAKAISQVASGLLGAVTNVAGAILDDGTIIANNIAGEANALEGTMLAAEAGLAGGAASATSVMRDLNIAVSQGTGIVGIIVGDATSIVGSMLAGMTGASNIGALSNLPSPSNTKPATTSEPQEFLPQSNLHNSSTTAASHNITAAPSLNTTVPKPTSTTGSACPPPTTCATCPPASTKTCTVTETWHMTHYESTATLFSFANVYTVTYTETKTISACPSSACSSPNATLSTLPKPALIACANGAFVKREEDCPLPNYDYNTTAPLPTHPCPDTGYSCSECPDGYFCPPQQTPAQSCPCGSGWACGHCSQSWFCAPDPTNVSGNGLLNSVASLISAKSTAPGEQTSPAITKAATLKTNIPNVSAAATALGLNSLSSSIGAQPLASVPELKAAISAISQVNGAHSSAVGSNMFNSVIGELISVFGKASGLPGDLMAQVTAALGSVTVASGNGLPTIVTAGQSLGTLPLPIPTIARDFEALPNDGFRELTKIIKSSATVLPVIVPAANGLPAAVPAIEMLGDVAPTKLPVIKSPPGLLYGANAGGLKVRRRGAKEEG